MIVTFHPNIFNKGDKIKVLLNNENDVYMTFYKSRVSAHPIPNLNITPFALTFTTDIQTYIEPGTYKMVHETVGTFEIMITPIVAALGNTTENFYEAYFS